MHLEMSQATLQDWLAKKGREAQDIVQQHVATVKTKAPELQKMVEDLQTLSVEEHRINIGMMVGYLLLSVCIIAVFFSSARAWGGVAGRFLIISPVQIRTQICFWLL